MSVRDSLFEAFEERGPNAQTASEWAEEFDTGTDYVYKLRSEFKDRESDTDPEPDPTPESEDDTTPEVVDDPTTNLDEVEGWEPDDEGESAPDTDSIQVDHEGSEKLSPAGHEDESVSSVDMPDGLEHLSDKSPEDFEPDPEPDTRESTPESPPENVEKGTDPVRDSSDEDDGFLSKLRGGDSGGEAESSPTEEVVDDADTDAERNRRRELLGELEERTTVEEEANPDSEGDPAPDPELSPGANGLHMDEDLMATMFGLPFAQASNATGWDGWELSEAEKQANAELLVAYCQEQNIDMSIGGMLAMSLLSTVGGRVAGYARYRKQETPATQGAESREVRPDSGGDTSSETPDEPPTEDTTTQPRVPDSEPTEEQEDDQSDGFDFSDSSTW